MLRRYRTSPAGPSVMSCSTEHESDGSQPRSVPSTSANHSADRNSGTAAHYGAGVRCRPARVKGVPPMAQVAVVAKITALPGKRDEVVDVLRDVVAATDDEPGTLVYAMNIDKGDDDVIWFYELYTDDA